MPDKTPAFRGLRAVSLRKPRGRAAAEGTRFAAAGKRIRVTIRAAGRLLAASLVLFVLAGVAAFGQTAPAAATPAATPSPAKPPEDTLGRTTPRGTLAPRVWKLPRR